MNAVTLLGGPLRRPTQLRERHLHQRLRRLIEIGKHNAGYGGDGRPLLVVEV